MADKHQIKCNGQDISQMVDFSQYKTAVQPVYSDAITTLDKVDHFYKIRDRGILHLSFNSLTAIGTARLCTLHLAATVELEYHCLQRNRPVKAVLRLDEVSAQKLYRVQYGGQSWREIDDITLTEL